MALLPYTTHVAEMCFCFDTVRKTTVAALRRWATRDGAGRRSPAAHQLTRYFSNYC